MLQTLRVSLLCFGLLINSSPALTQGQAPAPTTKNSDPDIQARIRKEGMENSQIMRTMHFLADIYGPRLTGSPNHKASAEWAIKQMAAWGLDNAHLEPWDFDHPGWANERLFAHVISPYKEPLVCEVVAWTPSTNGTVSAPVAQIEPPYERSTQEELTNYFNSIREKVKGKIVMVGKHTFTPVVIYPPAKRLDDQQVKAQLTENTPPGPQPLASECGDAKPPHPCVHTLGQSIFLL